MAKKKSDTLTDEQIIANHLIPIEVDVGLTLPTKYDSKGNVVHRKPIKSLKVDVVSEDGTYRKEYWKAVKAKPKDESLRNSPPEYFWTANPKDPKVLNVHDFGDGKPPKPRGSLSFITEGGNPKGKPKGALNKVSVKEALNKQHADPAEFLTGVMTGNHEVLRRYRVKDTKDITLAQKIKVAQVLLDKSVPSLKPADWDGEGGALMASNDFDDDSRKDVIQVYLPEKGAHVEIAASESEVMQISKLGVDKYMDEHVEEVLPYDPAITGDSETWEGS